MDTIQIADEGTNVTRAIDATHLEWQLIGRLKFVPRNVSTDDATGFQNVTDCQGNFLTHILGMGAEVQ